MKQLRFGQVRSGALICVDQVANKVVAMLLELFTRGVRLGVGRIGAAVGYQRENEG